MFKGFFMKIFPTTREAPAYNQKMVDLNTNFMSYPQNYINTQTPEGKAKFLEITRNPGTATRGQIAAIIRYYQSNLLNVDDR